MTANVTHGRFNTTCILGIANSTVLGSHYVMSPSQPACYGMRGHVEEIQGASVDLCGQTQAHLRLATLALEQKNHPAESGPNCQIPEFQKERIKDVNSFHHIPLRVPFRSRVTMKLHSTNIYHAPAVTCRIVLSSGDIRMGKKKKKKRWKLFLPHEACILGLRQILITTKYNILSEQE